MIGLLTQGEFLLFAILLAAIVASLSFHEFGHAACAKLLGDDTAERHGRLTLNPLAHIDPMGLLMVIAVGFGYAKPVPVSPMRLRHAWAEATVAFAGPFANLILAALCVNILVWGMMNDIALLNEPAARVFFLYLARINLLLMLFNLIPVGPLDGHYIMQWLLPPRLAMRYRELNRRFGSWALLGLILLAVAGVPVFSFLAGLSDRILPFLTIV